MEFTRYTASLTLPELVSVFPAFMDPIIWHKTLP